jgi:type I restriction enzyme M protein
VGRLVRRGDRAADVDASALFRRGRNQNTLEPEHRKRIEAAFEAFADEEGFAHVATLGEITNNGFDLNISRYVSPADEEELPTLAAAVAELKTALDEAYGAENRLLELLKREGLVDEEATA